MWLGWRRLVDAIGGLWRLKAAGEGSIWQLSCLAQGWPSLSTVQSIAIQLHDKKYDMTSLMDTTTLIGLNQINQNETEIILN